MTIIDRAAGETLLLAQGDGSVPGAAEKGDNFGLQSGGQRLHAGRVRAQRGPGIGKQARERWLGLSGGHRRDGAKPTVAASAPFTLDSLDVDGSAARGDRFGLALAFARTEVGTTALLVGAPQKNDGSALDAGVVTAFYSQVGGLYDLAASRSFGQSTKGIKEKPENGDQFGSSIGANG